MCMYIYIYIYINILIHIGDAINGLGAPKVGGSQHVRWSDLPSHCCYLCSRHAGRFLAGTLQCVAVRYSVL